MSHFFALLARMKFIQRWGLMRNTMSENIQEHSLQVAMIAHALAVIRNQHFGGTVDSGKAALLGMYHEVSEIFTGDLPTPVKYFNPQIKEVYKGIEDMAQQKLYHMLPAELKDPYKNLLTRQVEDAELWRLVKAADKISAYLKCVEELKVGNQEFSVACKTIKQELDESSLPEVKYFMEVFVPSFSLSLDEINYLAQK
jgi:5'-deoxynucleotidase